MTLDFRRPTTSRPISEVRGHFPYSKNKFKKKSSDGIPRNAFKWPEEGAAVWSSLRNFNQKHVLIAILSQIWLKMTDYEILNIFWWLIVHYGPEIWNIGQKAEYWKSNFFHLKIMIFLQKLYFFTKSMRSLKNSRKTVKFEKNSKFQKKKSDFLVLSFFSQYFKFLAHSALLNHQNIFVIS